MQRPVVVPANGGPSTCALITSPEGPNLTKTRASPGGSPGYLQARAADAAASSETSAAARSKAAPSVSAAALADGGGNGGLSGSAGRFSSDSFPCALSARLGRALEEGVARAVDASGP